MAFMEAKEKRLVPIPFMDDHETMSSIFVEMNSKSSILNILSLLMVLFSQFKTSMKVLFHSHSEGKKTLKVKRNHVMKILRHILYHLICYSNRSVVLEHKVHKKLLSVVSIHKFILL